MIWFRRLLSRIPRPSLLWMSPNDILRVRNELAGLCYPRGDFFLVGDIEVYPGLIPKMIHRRYRTIGWLKFRGPTPCWDITNEESVGLPKMVAFNAPEAGLFPDLVRTWADKFPFKPHDASLTHKGDFLV